MSKRREMPYDATSSMIYLMKNIKERRKNFTIMSKIIGFIIAFFPFFQNINIEVYITFLMKKMI